MHSQPSPLSLMISKPLLSPEELRALLSSDAMAYDEDPAWPCCASWLSLGAVQPVADVVFNPIGKA